jgi:transposase-like protein
MNENENSNDNWTPAPLAGGPPATPPPARRPPLLRRRAASIAAFSGLAIGGVAGGVVISQAATASPSPSASSSPSTTAPGYGGHRDHGPMMGNPTEDTQVAADAIGISLSQLQTALDSGQTIAAVAKAHGVDASKVISALAASENKEIDAALAAGSITQAQATQMKAGVQQRVTDMVNGVRPAGRPGGPYALQSEDLTVVAGAIGISTGDLQTALSSGQTIAAVAKAHNVDVDKVISAWVASENQEIDSRVSSGQITSAQAAQMKAQTQQRITDEVNGVRPAGGPGDGHGPGGPGGPWGGPGPDGGSSSGSGTTQSSSTGTSA